MGSADAGLEHAAAPDRNAGFAANFFDQFCLRVAADAADFYVDDLAGSELDRFTGVVGRLDRFVEADRGFDLAWSFA